MISRFFRISVLAFGLISGANALAADSIAIAPMSIVLAPADDFAPGSAKLEVSAQNSITGIMAALRPSEMNTLVVTGFADTADAEQRSALAKERAQSLRAFFILNGVDADKIRVFDGGNKFERPGQVQFTAWQPALDKDIEDDL